MSTSGTARLRSSCSCASPRRRSVDRGRARTSLEDEGDARRSPGGRIRPARRRRGLRRLRRRVAPMLARRALRRPPPGRERSRCEHDGRRAAPRAGRGERRLARGQGRAATDARRLPARGSRSHGHAPGLRARLLRQLQRAARRRVRAGMPALRRPGAGSLARDRGRARCARRHARRRCSRRSATITDCSAASARPRC